MNKKLRELLAAKAAALAAAQAISDGITDGATMTAEQRTAFDAHLATVETLNGDIQRQEALNAMLRNAPAASIEVGADHATEKPWGSLKEQLRAIKQHATSKGAKTDPRLMAALGANETVDSEGGFLIAPEFAPGVWQRTYDTSVIAKRCFNQPMSSNRLVINAVDEDSRVDGSRWGGILSYYLGEAGTYTATKPKFRRMELIAHKLIALIYATDEQLEDGPAFAAYVDQVVPQELAFTIDNNIYNGPGSGAPLGFMNAGALLTVTKASGDSGAVISNTDIFNMWKRMWAPSRMNAAWFINQDTEDQLWNLTRGSGTAVELLYTAPGERGNNGQYGVMMGRPVIPVEYAATVGTPGDIVLADMTQYCFATKGETKIDTSIHVAFLTGEQAFRWQVRHDGQPYWKKPLTPKNGSNTLSPFIALSTRS
jgi:HK97 family phage major capsid protein